MKRVHSWYDTFRLPYGIASYPYSESLVDEHQNSINTPYKYNAKELDDETGNDYYGARYYDPKYSFWLSVDPLAEQMPSWSPYNYAFDNPIRYNDPTGMVPEGVNCCPDPVAMTDNGDGSFGGGSLDTVVMAVQQSDAGKAKDAENKISSYYNNADWIRRQNAMASGGHLAHLYRVSEQNGIYPKPSQYDDYYEGTAENYLLAWNGWNEDDDANFLMNAAAYGIGCSLAATVGGAVFLEAGETGGLAYDLFGANGGFGHTIGRVQWFYKNPGVNGGTIFHYQNAAKIGQTTRYFRLDYHLVKRASGQFVQKMNYHSAKRTLGQMSTRSFKRMASIHRQLFTGRDFTTF